MTAAPTPAPEVVYRFCYTSTRDNARWTTRVVLHARTESDGLVLLLIRPIGRWPDRADLTALAEVAEERGVPMVKGIVLTTETEAAWREANLRPENGGDWKAA